VTAGATEEDPPHAEDQLPVEDSLCPEDPPRAEDQLPVEDSLCPEAPDRMHDRLLYERAGERWSDSRLSP